MKHHGVSISEQLVVRADIINMKNGQAINVPMLVDCGCEGADIVLVPDDITRLGLDRSIKHPEQSIIQPDGSLVMMQFFQEVTVTLSFNDGSTVSGDAHPQVFPPREEIGPDDTSVVPALDERIIGYSVLRRMGLKQDFKKHCLIRAIRRI